MGQKKEIIGCKAHVSLLGPQHPALPTKTNDPLFFGQITLVQLCTIHLLMDFTTANNLAKIEFNKAKNNWVKFLGYKALPSIGWILHFFFCNIIGLKEPGGHCVI